MNRPSSARSTWSISAAVPASRGTTSVAANRRIAATSGSSVSSSTALGVPAAWPAAPPPVRGPAPRPRRRLPRSSLPSSARPSAWRRPGTRAARRRTAAAPAGSPAPGRARPRPSGAWPRTCRPSRIWTSLISHSQPSTCSSMSSNAVVLGPVGQTEVVVHLGGPHQRPDLLADRGQLARVQRGDVGVLVEQLLQPGDVAVGLGAGHRRDQVVDQGGVRPALGLGALARVVDQERVDQRQVAECGVGAARRGHADGLAGQPLQVAVLAEVHDGVRRRTRASQPEVGGQVVVAGRQVGIVVDGHRVLAEPARRLDQDHDVARIALRRRRSRRPGRGCGRRTARRAADPSARPSRRSGRRAGWRTTRGSRAAGIRIGLPASCAVGEPVRVLPAALDERVHQRVAISRPSTPGIVADVVAGRPAAPSAARRRWPGCPDRRRCRSGSAWSGRPRTPAPPACPAAATRRSRA